MIYPHLSVYDNIAFSLKYRKIAKTELRQRVAEAARILELEPYGSDGPAVHFGGHRLHVPPAVVAEHPALEQYLGRDIVLGIRPESMQDADLAHDGDPSAIIELPVKLREELGSEVHIHGAIGTAAHVSGSESDDVHSLATMVARLDPRTTIAEGQVARVRVNTGGLHFFDPGTGASLRR